jgi:hypothetical protein
MISKRSFDPLVWVYRVGAWGLLVPYYWDQNEERLINLRDQPERRRSYKFWKILAAINILGRLFFVFGSLGVLALEPTIVPSEIIMGLFFIFVCLIVLPLHAALLLNGHLVAQHLNALLFLNRTSGWQIQ